MSKQQPITRRQAIERMRLLSHENIPFQIGFITCNTTNQSSNGYKVVDKALLREGYRGDQSAKSDTLVGYVDATEVTEKNRQFHYCLLFMFNGQILKQ